MLRCVMEEKIGQSGKSWTLLLRNVIGITSRMLAAPPDDEVPGL